MHEKNKIPAHWEVKSISEVCEILDGLRRPVNSTERMKRINDKPEKELYPYYGATGQVGLIDDYILDGEYILLGEDGAPFLDPFKDKAYLVKGKMWINNHAHILKSKYSNKFLCYYLNNINYKEFISGTTRLKLNQSSMREIPVPLPPLSEQHLIVEKIEELFSEQEAGRLQLETVKEQLKTYRQAVLSCAFEGKLTNDNAIQKQLPEGWKWVKVRDIAVDIQYGHTETASKKTLGPKFLRITDIQDNRVNWDTVPYCKISKDDFVRKKLEDGDLVFARTGATVGKSYLIKGDIPESVFASYLIRIRFPEFISDKYVWYFFQSNIYWQQIFKGQVGTGQPNVNGKKLGELYLPLPPFSEQQKIVKAIESRFLECDKLIEIIKVGLQQNEVLKQSILKQAFEGKLVKTQTN